MKIETNKITAIIPKYTENGDYTYLFSDDGKIQPFDKPMRTFLRRLFWVFTIDRLAMKAKFRKLGIHQNAPIVIEDIIFVKIKVRKPRTKSDFAYGYINIEKIEKLTLEGKTALVHLTGGMKLKSLDSYATLSKNIFLTQSLREKIVEPPGPKTL